MDISSVNADLIRGNSTTIILGALWSRDRYGYEIIQEIDEKTDGQYKVKQATLYNQLKKLEKAGLITSYDGAPDDTSGGRRRYYSLTVEGRNFLLKEKSEYVYSRTILDKLISEEEFDFSNPAPFDTESLRPYTKTGEEEKPKVVYKEKIVEVEKPVEVVKEVEVIKEVPVEVVKEVEVEKETKIYIDADGNVITEEDAKRIAEEARIREEERQARASETMKPASSLAEMFARFDTQSEYEQKSTEYVVAPTPVDESAAKAEEPAPDHTYFTAFTGENGSRTRSQSSLKEIFERLERQEAEIDSKNEEPAETVASDVQVEEPVHDVEFVEAELEQSDHGVDNSGVTAAVIGKRDENFEYEGQDVNYRDFFSSIVSAPEEKAPAKQESTVTYDQDLKSRLYQKGFKIRPYDRGNTSEYYTFNFIHSNRINRDSWLLVMALYIVEVAIMWVSLIGRVSYAYFLSFMLVGSALMLIPTVVCLFNPSKRVRANFNFKLSIINRGMIFIELTVVCILIGFFAVGASINDTILLLETIVLPAVLLTNLPVSSVVYYLLYRSRKYHTA